MSTASPAGTAETAGDGTAESPSLSAVIDMLTRREAALAAELRAVQDARRKLEDAARAAPRVVPAARRRWSGVKNFDLIARAIRTAGRSLSLREIREATGVPNTSVRWVVEKLRPESFVVGRGPDGNGRRSILYGLTPEPASPPLANGACNQEGGA